MSAIYRAYIRAGDKLVPKSLAPVWNHEAGPKTIFFWAPAFKWGLVIASFRDMKRPADRISPTQVGSLGLTGVIWARYSLVIIPKNWLSFSVNCFVAISNFYQLFRVYSFRQSQIENVKAE